MIKNHGNRLTNFFHLAEILHKQSIQQLYSCEELLYWRKKDKALNQIDGDEYIQRIGNDENAVQIVTIHQSKGLAYNIVFAPHLDFSHRKNESNITEFKKDGDHVFAFSMNEEDAASSKTQIEQEDRRLISVALTRALYGIYIYEKRQKT